MKQLHSIDMLKPSKGALDFSYLLDAPAGKKGFVTVKDGHFYFENGERQRFIGFNIATRSNTPSHEMAERMAERFASLGVNVIRLHAADAPIGEEERSWSSCKEAPLLDYNNGTSKVFNPEGLDRFDYLIAKLKEKGIYLHIDLIVAREFFPEDGLDYGVKIASCTKKYCMFNEKLIELQKQYAKELLTHVNPYTGLAIVDDPAVMTVQINNEDSAIKGTMDSDWNPEMQPYRDEVNEKWNKFLLEKYGSREELKRAWTFEGVSALKDDEDPTQNTVKPVLGDFYQPTNDPMKDWTSEVEPVRYGDFMEFGIKENKRFYTEMKSYLKELGVKVPINCSNLISGAADVYSHTDGDVMENNSYFNHPMFPLENGGYNIAMPTEYCTVNPLTVQTYMGSMATTILSLGSVAVTDGKPFVLSEWNDYGLVPFHSTSFMHTVAYACLNDWDGLILYNYQTTEKDNCPADEILSVFDAYNDPSLICQWGMMVEVFLKGLVSSSKHKIDIAYTPEDLKTLPNMMAAPIMYLPYVTKMRNVFMEGEKYSGCANAVVNAGFVNSGDLSANKHGVYYAWSPYTDVYRKELNSDRLSKSAEGSTELAGGVHLSDSSLVYDNIQQIAGTGNYTEFATYLDKALKKWNILEDNQGLVIGELVSDTGELVTAPNEKQFKVKTDKFAYFSGAVNGEIDLLDFVSVDAKNEKISLGLLSRENTSDDEYLLFAMSGSGMSETNYSEGPEMMGYKVTHVSMNGKLYIEPLEGNVKVKAQTAKLYALSQIGEVIQEFEGVTVAETVEFHLDGTIPSAQYKLVVNR